MNLNQVTYFDINLQIPRCDFEANYFVLSQTGIYIYCLTDMAGDMSNQHHNTLMRLYCSYF